MTGQPDRYVTIDITPDTSQLDAVLQRMARNPQPFDPVMAAWESAWVKVSEMVGATPDEVMALGESVGYLAPRITDESRDVIRRALE